VGNTKNIETPEKLWELFTAYVLHERDNPMFKREYVGKDGEEKNTPLETPITFQGFECYLQDVGVLKDLGDYASDKQDRYTEYAAIITRIRKNCFVHNYKGAAVGLFNANLIARKLGLTEKQDVALKTQVSPFTSFDLDVSEDNGSS
jgi:hypothetical protein